MKYGEETYVGSEDLFFEAGKIKANEKNTYLLKHFAESYSAALHLLHHPRDVNKFANNVHELVEIKIQPSNDAMSDAQP